MNPFIMIAARVLPDIIKAVASDNAGTVTGDIAKAVTEITKTKNPEEARDKLNADPAAVTALQLKLAEITSAQEEKRQQAQLAAIQSQNEAETKKREADLARMRAQLEDEAKRRDAQLAQIRAENEDRESARAHMRALAGEGGFVAATAPVLSYIVTFGFFVVLLVLVFWGMPRQSDNSVLQVINIVIGALTAAFATVVNFWLGSSQGSRSKDMQIQLQAEQVQQASAAAIATQAKQAQVLQTSMETQARQAEALQSTVKTAIAATSAGDGQKVSNFQPCLDIVYAQEGGFCDDRNDPRGPVQFGVTLEQLRSARSDRALTVDDLKKLTRDQAREIHRTQLWNLLQCDNLPAGVDLVVFDFGVTDGPSQAAQMLQQIVGAEADGSIGPVTIAAAKTMPAKEIVRQMSDRRRAGYRSAPNAQSLTSRANTIENAALQMIAAPIRLVA